MRRVIRLGAWLIAVVTLVLAVLLMIGLAEATDDPLRRELSLTLPEMLRGTPPYRIALLSDIHFGNRAMRRERLERIVAAVNRAQPDLVVITGDFVNGHKTLETDPALLVAPLSRLRARYGVAATLGNHDHWTDPHAVQAALESAGVTVLLNRTLMRGPVAIAGVDDDFSGHADPAAAMASLPATYRGPVVAITHSPDVVQRLPDRIGLLLAGHTHCGQVVFPVIGSLAPIFGKLIGDRHYFGSRYRCGVVRDAGRTTVVTAGVGSGSIPVRIGAPPDWWLVTLKPL